MAAVTPLVVPQVNVNDDTVLLVRWLVASGAAVKAGDAVCDVETTKAVSEIAAPADGVLVQSIAVGTRVAVGAPIGAIGPTREAVDAALAAATEVKHGAAASGATPKAVALAAQHGVSLAAVRASGVRGAIKETDVRRFVDGAAGALPGWLAKHVEREGEVPAFDASVSANLRRSTTHLILASVDMECRLTAAREVIQRALAGGKMLSPLHLVIAAVGRVLPSFPKLASFVWNGSVYRYRGTDVAFVARTGDGRLFTPVLRGVDRLPIEDIARLSQAAAMRALRGTAKADELEGAAFTISQVPVPGTTRVVALPSFGQSAILGLSAERIVPAVVDGRIETVPVITLTLNYDHALCDGIYAANFLAALVKELEIFATRSV
jgi:pyruvate dehydrogenase E2 component (dihydrolipoamide acetyltransferase)